MAIAAVLGDQQPGLVEEGILHVVRGVAVRADRRLRIALLQYFLAVHRGFVSREFRGVAGAASIRQIEPPPITVGSALRIDVVGVVAIVAGGVGVRLIFLVRLRVDRLHIAADHVDDAAQLGDLIGLVIVFRRVQQTLMAVDAADFHLDLFMRNLGDVGVALDALPLAMHAAQEAVLQHRRRRARLRLCSRRESFLAVTAETHFAGELGSGLIGRCALRPRVRRPQAGHCDQANEAGGDPAAARAIRPPTPKCLAVVLSCGSVMITLPWRVDCKRTPQS